MVVVTSAPGADDQAIGNWLFTSAGNVRATTPRLDQAPNGAGDLTAALMVSALLKGVGDAEALRRTTASVFQVLNKAIVLKSDELPLERCLDALLDPSQVVRMDEGVSRR